MEPLTHLTPESADLVRQSSRALGAVEISQSGLQRALIHIREEKEAALDAAEFDALATWRDNENNVMVALGGLGLAQP